MTAISFLVEWTLRSSVLILSGALLLRVSRVKDPAIETMLRNGFDKLKKMYGSRGLFNFVAVPVMDPDETRKVVNLTINIQEG